MGSDFDCLDIPHKNIRLFLQTYLYELKNKDKELKENNKIFRDKYGIGRPPFLTRKKIPNGFGIDKIKENTNKVKIYGENYSFTEVYYMSSFLGGVGGHSSISFDKGLIEKIKEKGNLIEIKAPDTYCVTCDNKKGKIYFTDILIPLSNNKYCKNATHYKRGLIDCNRDNLYLFDRPCHSYLAADSNFNLLPQEPKKRSRTPKIEFRRG
jgi:hypothetical protein